MSERRPQVLVIDDEKSVCLTCSRILELDGLAVEYATSGIAGLERAVREGFDVVLLDFASRPPPTSSSSASSTFPRPSPDKQRSPTTPASWPPPRLASWWNPSAG